MGSATWNRRKAILPWHPSGIWMKCPYMEKQDLCHQSFPAAGSAVACIRTALEGGSTLMSMVL